MGLRDALYRVYWRLERALAPRLRYAQELYEEELCSRVTSETRWLDAGCGHQILSPWRLSQERRLVAKPMLGVGVDSDLDSLHRHRTLGLRVCADIGRLPFAEGSFDLVTANMVFEHLPDPTRQFRETARVLAPRGILLVHTPNARGYATLMARLAPQWLKRRVIRLLEGRGDDDAFVTYYRANSRSRLVRLARESGLEPLAIEMKVSTAVFAVVPPVAALELLWVRLLMTRPFGPIRTNIIAAFSRLAPTQGNQMAVDIAP